MTHKYKGKEYEVQTGKKGGQFFIDDAGKKHYLKGTTSNTSKKSISKKRTELPTKTPEEIEIEKPKTYICYYSEYNDSGEMIDDFKEWTESYSYDEAKEYFEDNYRHNPNVKIDMITREK